MNRYVRLNRELWEEWTDINYQSAFYDVEGFLVNGHHALRVQLAQRHLQPGPGSGDLVHAVELEVEQLPDPHAGSA